MDKNELAEKCAQTMYAKDQASPALGINIERVTPGHAEVSMIVAPWMANGAQVCHGGLIFTLADTAMAFASNAYNEQMLAINATIEFVAAGKIGETLTATARELHRAGRTATYQAAVTDQHGELVAQFMGRTYRVRGQHVDVDELAEPAS